MMKKLLIAVVLIFTVLASDDTQLNTITQDFEDSSSWADKIKAIKCIKNAKTEVTELIALAKQLMNKDYHGSVKAVYTLVKRIFVILKDCKVFFCFGPSIKKCEIDHPAGCEKTGLIVYPKCKPGFTNWDCCVCATICPPRFTDNGLYCLKPKAYGRGVGYVLWEQKKCEKENSQGCEKNGALWYPKCAEGFHNVGCCICSPNCPSGWTDIGISCKKPESYGRGIGYAVSYGLQCLIKFPKMACGVQKSTMQELIKSLEFKGGKYLDTDEYQSGIPDEIKDLAHRVDNFTSECYEEPKQIEQ